jgi:hypothetical protein
LAALPGCHYAPAAQSSDSAGLALGSDPPDSALAGSPPEDSSLTDCPVALTWGDHCVPAVEMRDWVPTADSEQMNSSTDHWVGPRQHSQAFLEAPVSLGAARRGSSLDECVAFPAVPVVDQDVLQVLVVWPQTILAAAVESI